MQGRWAVFRCSRRKLAAVRARGSDAEAVVIVGVSWGLRYEAFDFSEERMGSSVFQFRRKWAGRFGMGAKEHDRAGVIGLEDHEGAEAGKGEQPGGFGGRGANHQGAGKQKRLFDLSRKEGATANFQQPRSCVFMNRLRTAVVDGLVHSGAS